MKIYYATMTGNTELLASSMTEKAKQRGLDTTLVDLGEINPSDLLTDTQAVFIVSTWGEGEPPDDADAFWLDMEAADLDLSQLNYAVFGLGDSGYDNFNGFARNLDERLEALGAKSFFERVDSDIDYNDDFDAWEAKVFERMSER